MKIKEILEKGILELQDVEDSKLKVKIILADILKVKKEYFIIHYTDEISNEYVQEFFEKIEKLKQGMPVQYIINSQEFMGLNFYVDENVLIPQPDTEILVEETIKILNENFQNIKSKINVLDMCTGSGAIGISIAKLVENANVVVSDISNEALKIAKKNANSNDVKIELIHSDLFEKIPLNTKFNIIASNPPYIKTDVINNLSKEVKNEPFIALDGGNDGLMFYRKIIQNAKKYLESNGFLILEIGYDQKNDVTQLLEKYEYKKIYSKKDFGGNDRIVVAQI